MPATSALAKLDAAALDQVRLAFAPNASDEELSWFGAVAQRLELDPFRGQIVLVPRYDKRVGRDVARPQITVDGRRAMAVRSGNLDGIDGPFWTGPRDSYGELRWSDVWTGDGTPYAAKCVVWRKDAGRSFTGTVKWGEWVPTDSRGNLAPLWIKYPSHMLGKSAESLALRRAFPELIADGLVAVDGDLIDGDYIGSPEASTEGVTVAREVVTTHSPEPPERSEHEYVWPRPLQHDQGQRINRLFADLGLDGPEHKAKRFGIVSDIVRRIVTALSQLSESDGWLVIGDLEARVALKQAQAVRESSEGLEPEEPPL